jgi:hypothetical protein
LFFVVHESPRGVVDGFRISVYVVIPTERFSRRGTSPAFAFPSAALFAPRRVQV